MKPRNDLKKTRRFTVRGVQILTGKESARANDVPAGVYHVEQGSRIAHRYARGKRVAIKLYFPDGFNFQEQYNKDLTEITMWLEPEEWDKAMDIGGVDK